MSKQWNILDFGREQLCFWSAIKKGDGVNELLEAVSLEAEVLDLKAHHNGPAFGVVLDSTTETGKGAVATVLVQKGTLNTCFHRKVLL